MVRLLSEFLLADEKQHSRQSKEGAPNSQNNNSISYDKSCLSIDKRYPPFEDLTCFQ